MDMGTSKRIKVALYGRVSTESDEQHTSYENQKEYLQHKYGYKSDFDIVDTYVEKGSGTSVIKRKEFVRMLYDAGIDVKQDPHNKDVHYHSSIREPKFNRIVVNDITRFGRTHEVIKIMDMLKGRKVYVDFDINGMSTEQDSTEPIIGFLALIGAYDSKEKAKKIRRGHIMGQKNGVIHQTPYGYRKIDKMHLEIVEAEAQTIKEIYKLYLGGNGVRKIKYELERRGFVPPRRFVKKDNKIHPMEWSRTTITNVLRNPVYTGTLIRNKYTHGSVFSEHDNFRKKPEDEWTVHRNHTGIPVIIDNETFEAVQKTFKGRINSESQKGMKLSKHKYAGMLVCGKCGSKMTHNTDHGKGSFICSTKRNRTMSVCDAKNITDEDLEEQLKWWATEGYLNDVSESGSIAVERLIERKQELQERLKAKADSKAISQLVDEMDRLKSQRSTYIELLDENLIDIEDYKRKYKSVSEKISLFETELNELTATKEEMDVKIQRVTDEIERLQNNKLEPISIEEFLSRFAPIFIDDGEIRGIELFIDEHGVAYGSW